MGMWQRVRLVFAAKTHRALDKLEDPRETLDYSYQKQVDLLRKVRQGLVTVAASRHQLQRQIDTLRGQAERLTEQATKALSMDREDLAREALTRKATLLPQVADLTAQRDQLAAEEERLTQALRTLQARVEAFRTRKETLKATYTAAQAQTHIGEAFTGLGNELGDVGQVIQRAEDKTAQMQARASAIGELVDSGALEDLTNTQRSDDISRELDSLSAASEVELELSRMKARVKELPAGS